MSIVDDGIVPPPPLRDSVSSRSSIDSRSAALSAPPPPPPAQSPQQGPVPSPTGATSEDYEIVNRDSVVEGMARSTTNTVSSSSSTEPTPLVAITTSVAQLQLSPPPPPPAHGRMSITPPPLPPPRDASVAAADESDRESITPEQSRRASESMSSNFGGGLSIPSTPSSMNHALSGSSMLQTSLIGGRLHYPLDQCIPESGSDSDDDAVPTMAAPPNSAQKPNISGSTMTAEKQQKLFGVGGGGALGGMQHLHSETLTTPRSRLNKRVSTSSSFPASTAFNLQHRWDVEKANKFGLKVSRTLVLDLAGHAIRFFGDVKMKSEVPLNQIAYVGRKSTNEPKKIEMQFKEDSKRSYELFFKTEDEAESFEKLISNEIDDGGVPGGGMNGGKRTSTGSGSGSHMSRTPAGMRALTYQPTSPSVASLNGQPSGSGKGGDAGKNKNGANPATSANGSPTVSSANSTVPSGQSTPNHTSLQQRHGRASSDSSMHSDIISSVLASHHQTEDHNAYLDYIIHKKNRFGIKQQRILVLNALGRSLLLLDEKRKFKKEFAFTQIIGLDIPKSKDPNTERAGGGMISEAQCYLNFSKLSGQKPFHLYFEQYLDRLHFCERLIALTPHELVIKDESDHIDDLDNHKFGILKLNKMSQKKKRIVVIRMKDRVLRSFNSELSYKDTHFKLVLKYEKPLHDRYRLNIWTMEKQHPIVYIFPDTITRERFVVQCNIVRSMIIDEECVNTQNTMSAYLAGLQMTGGAMVTPAIAAPPATNATPTPSTTESPASSTPSTPSSLNTTILSRGGSGGAAIGGATTAAQAVSLLPPPTLSHSTSSSTISSNNTTSSLPSSSTSANSNPNTPPSLQVPNLSIFIGSWNLGNAGYTHESMNEFILPLKYDLYVIGLQECSKGHREQWLYELRNHIQGNGNTNTPASGAIAGNNATTNTSGTNNATSPTSASAAAAAAGAASPSSATSTPSTPASTSQPPSSSAASSSTATTSTPATAPAPSPSNSSSASRSDVYTNIEDEKDDGQSPYVLLGVVKLWEIVMMVLIRRTLSCNVTNLCMDTVATGMGDVLGNKGGVGISFNYLDSSLCFISCHLAARSERVVQRAENYMKIATKLQLGLSGIDIVAQYDHVFWLGDLNYRIELEYADVLHLMKCKEWRTLRMADQLLIQKSQQLVLAGYEEGLLKFTPTYRWERKENVVSNKRFQSPSWTDRVLWHSLPGLNDLVCDSYTGAPNTFGSDHRPVSATFTWQPRAYYTGRISRHATLPSITMMENENPHLVTMNEAFSPISTPSQAISINSSLASSTVAGGGTGSNSGSIILTSTSSMKGSTSSSTYSTSSVGSTTPGSSSSNNSLMPPLMLATPVLSSTPNGSTTTTVGAVAGGSGSGAAGGASNTSNTPYQHFSLTQSQPSMFSPPSSARSSVAQTVTKNFTPYQFTRPPKGPSFTPTPRVDSRAPLLGSTRDFNIVLNGIKVTLSNPPKQDFTLTSSASFLNIWPTTQPVSYTFAEEFGYHFDEVLLTPYIHDLYYLYTRHLLFSVNVPSIASTTPNHTSGVNTLGTGMCAGQVVISLGTICANVFKMVQSGGNANPAPGSKSSTSSSDPNRPGLKGDQGGYYFVEPIFREGLYAGQMEGRIQFRYK